MSFDSADGHTHSSPEHHHKAVHHDVLNAETHIINDPTPTTPPKHAEPAQKPSIGRIVHYVLDSGQSKGQHRPAMIVRVWSDTCVQLTVFTDWSNDFGPDQHGGGGILWRPSAAQDEGGENPRSIGTWHWPERV